MRKLLIPSIIVSTVLSFGLTAALQAAPQRYESPYSAYGHDDFQNSQLFPLPSPRGY